MNQINSNLNQEILAGVAVNHGNVDEIVLDGNELARSLYLDYKMLQIADANDCLAPSAERAVKTAIKAYYDQYSSRVSQYIDLQGYAKPIIALIGRELKSELNDLIENSIEGIPIFESMGTLLREFEKAEDKLKAISPGSETFKRSIDIELLASLLVFDDTEASAAGSLARKAIKLAYRTILFEQFATEMLADMGIRLDPKQLSVLIPQPKIIPQFEVWETFDRHLKPKLQSIRKIVELAENANLPAEETHKIIAEFIKKDKTTIPDWFLKQHKLTLSLPDKPNNLQKTPEPKAAEIVINEKKELLTTLDSNPTFSKLSDPERLKVIRILAKFQLSTAREIIRDQLNAEFTLDGLENHIRRLSGGYSNPKTVDLVPDKKSADIPSNTGAPQKQALNLDFSHIDLSSHPEKLTRQLHEFFELRGELAMILTSPNIKEIKGSSAYEYKQQHFRLYFTVEDGNLAFRRIGDKDSQRKDIEYLKRNFR